MNPAIKPFECPDCGEEIEADISRGAEQIHCGNCPAVFRLDADAELVDGAWRDRSKLVKEVDRLDSECALLRAFDHALNQNPFLWFEIGYTRITDWMVHVIDRAGGKNEKIIETQATDRHVACHEATLALKALYP